MILESKTVARAILRRAGLTGVAHRVRSLWHKPDYEDKFANALLTSVRADDCVWDVGANVGFYTERLAKLARRVVAFDPVLENCQQIESRNLANVECVQLALGETPGEMPMFVDHQFSSLVLAPYPGAPQRTVRVERGDCLPALPAPTVIKIDVEGFELEVIRGMRGLLGGVRAVFVEVHFQILSDRGMQQAPAALAKELKHLGFSVLKWPDASHLAAFREWQ
jgi:FkbM family methyltransferase